ncbi:MAG TPA: S9 family peptidase [Candidatus Polarisedimenticolia bacterium]|nr:S9 family peptidase [Candidatus Polarisedimenticolia bacterium]
MPPSRRRAPRLVVAGFALLVAGSGAAAPSARPLRLEDTVLFAGIEELRLSPDGHTVAVTVSRRAPDENRFTTDIYLVPADGSSVERALTRAAGNDGQPRFSPDGRRIAFVSDRSGRDEVWIMPVDGGEAIRLTDSEGVGAFAWNPDGRSILFTAPDPPDEARKKRIERGDDARVYGEWPASSLWRAWVEAELQNGPASGAATRGPAVRLTDGTMHVTDGIAPSPDGRFVAFVAQPTPEADASEEASVRLLEISTRQVTEVAGSRRASALAWSEATPARGGRDETTAGRPKGTILFARPFDGAGWSRADLFAWAPGETEPRDLSASVDRDIEQILPMPDGSMEVLWSQGALTETATVAADGRLGRPWSPLYPVASPLRAGDARLFVRLDRPHEVWRVDRAGAAHALTRFNADLIASLDLPALETVRWKSGPFEVEGVLTLPPAAGPAGGRAASSPRGGPYPLLVRPHGGPRANSLMEFGPHDAWLASLGYLVFEPNFRGSTGYGDRFAKGNGGDWGAGPFADIMAGVDALVASGRADPDRLFLYGWSYGGIMANWAATHSDRFRAIVSGAGVADLRMQYILSDARRWRFDYFGGSPFEPQYLPAYWANSPVTQVGKVKTPMLFIQGEQDRRCPLPQALMMHRAILDNGGDSTLVLYPREGHGFREPEHIVDRTRRIAAFFAAHGGLPVPEGDGARPGPAAPRPATQGSR